MAYDAEMLVAHYLAYDFLSKLFYESPTLDFVGILAGDDLFDCWPLDSAQPEMETGLAMLRACCASWYENQFRTLKTDYARLFVGPDHLLAPPWESVYRSADHILFDHATLEVRRHYQRFGMPIPKLNVEPDDHIGLEFRFVTHLCRLGLAALGQENPEVLTNILQELRTFIDAHLMKWAPDFLQAVIDNAATLLYSGAAHLALGCLAYTRDQLNCPTLSPVAQSCAPAKTRRTP
jgi:TorA maturation chaperone TorD